MDERPDDPPPTAAPDGFEQTPDGRARKRTAAAQSRAAAVSQRGKLWIENRDPATPTGAAVGWFRRYQAADGQLCALMLTAYVFMALLPVLLIEASYISHSPTAFADHVASRLSLDSSTTKLVRTVLAGTGENRLSSVTIAVLNAALFGLGIGRVLQIVYARSWAVDLRKSVVVDQARYGTILAALVIGSLLAVVHIEASRTSTAWIAWLLALGWIAAGVAFFVWAPRLLLHRRVPARDLLPGAVFTVLSLLVLRLVSLLVLANWLEWYSKTYGPVGIIMALFFWLVIAATVVILGAALSPTLAHRRDLRVQRRLEADGGP